jgi:cytosine/adenosine deaminase-related metal-dependent hydrolase
VRTLIRADWILPISNVPIRGGELLVEGGRILAVGRRGELSARGEASPPEVRDLGQVAVLPGLVNAHVHLELSWMRGAVPPADSMPAWARRLIELRRVSGGDDTSAIGPAIEELRAAGTALVGDVGNTLASCGPLSASPLRAVVFHELIGFNPVEPDAVVDAAIARAEAAPRAETVRVSLAAHAPYSTAPELFATIARRWAGRGLPVAVHLAESQDEVRFLRDGGGAWREILDEMGAWRPGWEPPGCGPAEYLDRLGFLGPERLAVHGVHLDRAELRLLASRGATIVSCPRSNAWTGAGTPPVAEFYESGARVAFGTDSLASVGSLNLFEELAAARRIAPQVPAGVLLRSATLEGARALGFGSQLGSIEPGKSAELISVSVPRSSSEIEEELVRGVSPDRIAWIWSRGSLRSTAGPRQQA